MLHRLFRGPVGSRSRAALDRAVAAAKAGEPVGEYLAELKITPVPAPTTDSGEGSDVRGLGPTDVGGEPVYLPGHYVCPRDVCTRAVYRTTASGLPECDLFDLPLRFVEER
jgi:hypothetical protein